MNKYSCIIGKNYLSRAMAFSIFISPAIALAGDTENFRLRFEYHLSQIASGNMEIEDLGKNLVFDVAVAVNLGASGGDIGDILISSAPNNETSINFQLSALLGAIGSLVDTGAIKGENAVAKDFYHSACEFAKSARLSQTVINIECSR